MLYAIAYAAVGVLTFLALSLWTCHRAAEPRYPLILASSLVWPVTIGVPLVVLAGAYLIDIVVLIFSRIARLRSR